MEDRKLQTRQAVVKEALKIIKEECKRHKSIHCETDDCLVYKILGHCMDYNEPENWIIEGGKDE